MLALHHADSRQFIDAYSSDSFDLVLFDSLIAFRHLEYQKLRTRHLLAPGAICIFHATSRRRGESMDSNADMVAALDEISQGNEWLERPFSRGIRILRVLESQPLRGKSRPYARSDAERKPVPLAGNELAGAGL